MMPPHHQQHPTQMNGRVDPRDDLVKPSDLLEPTVKNVDVSAVQKADFDANLRRSSASSSTGNPALAEEAQRAVDEAVSAAEKEAADKGKKEKKKNKKDKTKRGKDETSPNASTTTSIQSTPLMDAQQAQEEVPPMPDQVSEATANSESKAEESERVRLVAEQKRKMEESVKKKKTEEKKKLEEAAKVAAAATKKPKEDSKKKNKNRQHLIRQQVYESDSEDDGTVPSTLQAKLQAVKEWFVSFGKPQPRRRARSKTYRIWFNRCLQTMIVVLVGSLLTTLIAPSSRHDSSCRLMYEAVRRLCKDIADADCKGIASKARSLCYILESVPGMRLLELLVLFVVRLGRLSIFSRHQHSGNKGLIARCRLLPLQHHCSLGGTGHHDRLRWHLDTVLKLQQLEREGSFSNGLCVGEKCGALSMSRWNSGIRRHTGAYSLLCEQQFGEGAEFDGEMCACRKGYVVRGGMCRKVARGKGGGDDAGQLEGGGKNSKRLGAAGSGGAKCASRTKNKKGKARKAKEDFGGSRRAAGRHLGSLYP